MYINIQKVLYKSKFDALSIRTRRIALKRSFTNISLGESSPNFAFVPLYKKKKRTSLRILSTPRFEKSRFQLKEGKNKLKIYIPKIETQFPLFLSSFREIKTNFNLIE